MSNAPINNSKVNILVVDDTPTQLRLLVNILTENGYKVRPVANGKLALAAAQIFPPDLILLDIRMPGMNGYEVCENLKTDERFQDIPVIFISALNEVFDKVKAFSIGGVDYITKPFQSEEVLARIKTHLALRGLQKSLQSKNEDLEKTLQQLQNTQNQLIESEKMAAVGQLIASIAHEINNPLGAIRSSINHVAEFFEHDLERIPEFFQQLSPERQQDFLTLIRISKKPKLTVSTKEKREFKKAVVRQLKFYNIANANTIAAILVDLSIYDGIETFLPLLNDPESETILNTVYQITSSKKSTHTIITATERAAKVVFALKSYARYDATGKKVEANITDGIETALTLYQNQLKYGVEVVRNYEDSLPCILCYPDELNQVWTNLVHNALQAMNNKGTLTLNAIQQDTSLLVSITDSGKGIPPEIQQKIFDPFFTTKSIGEGSGLGLYIVKKIIDKHEGTIQIKSMPGKTTFTVLLPINYSKNN
jgi:signal transduction histidine kinase